MNINIPSNWLFPSSLEEASEIQQHLADRVRLVDDFGTVDLLGGMDVSNNLQDPKQMVYASAVLIDKESLKLQAQASAAQQQTFPYIPGFLAFRETPALIEAFQKLPKRPSIILVDGHGISHPRRLGIASHIGVLLDIPTIGVAKSILVGKPEGILGEAVGSHVPLIWKKQPIATILRTKRNCNPLIISAGHRITLETAIEIVMHSLAGYRLPEPTRQAHIAANARRRLS
ncbi:deoxyribonuclease V [Candidatus Protochlamydia phocaeensis]|uniref:deoxyribonuclease V n=1 Tax=Candidatus Protochlamydia phocaeensis TaxID=1414722 RepID=UPI000837CA2A|nr:deoxyribonuclease V [Candidatus Protochlamydia phocaeensis]